jgi:hypothetical protein
VVYLKQDKHKQKQIKIIYIMSDTQNNVTLQPLSTKRNDVEMRWVEGKITKGTKAGEAFYVPELTVTAETLPTWIKYLGDDVVAGKINAFVRLTSREAQKEASQDANEQPQDFNPQLFIQYMQELSVRGESMETLMENQDRLLTDFMAVGQKLQDALAGGNFDLAKEVSGKLAKVQNELQGIKSAIERKRRKPRAEGNSTSNTADGAE